MLPEETVKTERVEGTETVTDIDDAIALIKDRDQNYVKKELYLKAKEDNKKLLNELSNGNYRTETDEPAKELPTRIECLKKYKANNFSSNLDYWKNIVELRDATIREYGKDPTVTGNFGVDPNGDKVDAAYGEAEEMEAQFDTIKEMIEESNGDPEKFNMFMSEAIR